MCLNIVIMIIFSLLYILHPFFSFYYVRLPTPLPIFFGMLNVRHGRVYLTIHNPISDFIFLTFRFLSILGYSILSNCDMEG